MNPHLLNAFLAEAPVGMSLRDLDGRYLMVNAVTARRMGAAPSDVIGRTNEEIGRFTDVTRATVRAHERAVVREMRAIAEQRVEVESDGTRSDRLVTKFPVLDEHGDLAAIGTVDKDVTEQMNAERALREREENFRDLVQGSIQGIAIHRDLRFLFVNQAWADIHGYGSPDQVLALGSLESMIAEEELPRLRGYAGVRLREGGAPTRYEYRAVRADGARIVLQCTVSVIRWQGEPAVQAAVVDVTEQRAAQDALRESEARLSAFFDNSPHTMSIQAPDGRIVQDNPAVRRFSPLDPSEAKGRLPHELWSADFARTLEDTNRQVRERMTVADFEGALWVGGERKYLHITKFPIVDDEGLLLGLGSIGSDVTERRRVEEELRVSEARSRAFFDNSPHAMSIQAPDGRYLLDNESSFALYALDPAEVQDKLPAEVWPADIAARVERANEAVRRSRQPVEYENEVLAGDVLKQVHVAKFPILDHDGTLLGIGSIGSDVTARNAAESALKASRHRFRDFAEASSDWFWEMGADLRFTNVVEQDATSLQSVAVEWLNATLDDAGSSGVHEGGEWGRFRDLVNRRLPVRDIELPVLDPTGELHHIRTSGKVVRDGEGNFAGYRGVGTDVTDVVDSQRQANMLRIAIEESSLGVVLYDDDSRIVFTNPAFHEVFPMIPPIDLIGGMLREDMLTVVAAHGSPGDAWARDDPRGWARQVIERGVSDQAQVDETVYGGRTYQRKMVRVGSQGVMVQLEDITERKATQARLERNQTELRQLAAEVSLTAERERRRISTEIHDGAVQNLGLARIRLGALVASASGSPQAAQLEELGELLGQSIRELRTLMSELSPPMLYELGLEPAVEWLARRFRDEHGLQCEVQARAVPELPGDVSVLAFQAVRELLMNVVKHAGTSRASVEMSASGGALLVVVADDGVGIRPDRAAIAPTDSGGFGLFSVRERIGLVSGDLRIESGPGTRVSLRIPVGAS